MVEKIYFIKNTLLLKCHNKIMFESINMMSRKLTYEINNNNDIVEEGFCLTQFGGGTSNDVASAGCVSDHEIVVGESGLATSSVNVVQIILTIDQSFPGSLSFRNYKESLFIW